MKKYFHHILRSWRFHGIVQWSTCVVLIGVFSVVSFSFLIHQNLESVFHKWGDVAQVSVYLEDGVKGEFLENIKGFVEGSSYFKDIEYISKKVALQNFQGQISQDIINLITRKELENPLPASLEMKMAGDLSSSSWLSEMKSFLNDIKDMEGVEEVVFGNTWVDNYASFLKTFSYISLLIVIILFTGGLFVISNSIRGSISHRKKEIEILELVGATPSAIRRPYIIDGLLTGLFAAAFSLLICYLLFLWQSQIFQENLGFWQAGWHFSFLSPLRMIIILVMGVFLGTLGSWLCISEMNSGWIATQERSYL